MAKSSLATQIKSQINLIKVLKIAEEKQSILQNPDRSE